MRTFFFLLLLPHLLFSEEETIPTQNIPALVNLEGEPSAIVNRCVNVISGDWCEHKVDLVLPGPETLSLERCYVSSDRRNGSISYAWNSNLDSTLYRGSSWFEWFKGFGSNIVMVEDKPSKSNHSNLLHPSKGYFQKGVTNVSQGKVGGRTNPKNFRIEHDYDNKRGNIFFNDGSKGTIRTWDRYESSLFYLKDLCRMNGNKISYDWENTSRKTSLLLSKVAACGKSGEPFSWLSFKYPKKESKKIYIKGSDGRSVTYTMKRFGHDKLERSMFCLSKVERSHGPTDRYIYADKSTRIIRKEEAGGAFQEIGYFRKGSYFVGDKKFKIKERDDQRFNRVKELLAPVGVDAKPITTHRFNYLLNKKGGGSTEVFDAHGYKTIYQYSDDFRLTAVKKFDAEQKLYCVERLFWGKEKDEANLLCRTFEDGFGNSLFCRHFVYDAKGNILENRLYGNLTGEDQSPLHVVDGIAMGGDCLVKRYRYDENNLMVSEEKDEQQIFYNYHKGTDLLACKTVKANGQLKSKEHFTYDKNGVLICHRLAFANGIEQIRKITPTASFPIGLPKVVEQLYLDTQTKSEKLLQKVEFVYDEHGNALEERVYDANGNLAYFTQREYDKQGRVISEVDPLGRLIRKRWDERGNLVFERNEDEGYQKEYHFDLAGRVVKEILCSDDGELFTSDHTYDTLGNRLSTCDLFGQTTTFTYDPFGRVVATSYPSCIDSDGKIYNPTHRISYDPLSRPIEKTDPKGNKTRTQYSLMGKPLNILHPDGTCESWIYNLNGTTRSYTDQKGCRTDYVYDWDQRVIKKTLTGYDGEILDISSFTYDACLLTSETDFSGSTTHFRYDGACRLIEKEKEGIHTHYTYDSLGRLEKTYEQIMPGKYKVQVREYDLLGRVVEERVEDDDGAILEKTCYGYDRHGNKSKTSTSVGETFVVHDLLGRPIKKVDGQGNVTTIHYSQEHVNELGQNVGMIQTIDPLGNVEISIQNALGKVVETKRKSPMGTLLQKQIFTYDRNSNKTASILSDGEKQVQTRWRYDLCNRVTGCTEGFGTPEQRETTHRYNKLGLLAEICKPNGVLLSYSYDGKGRVHLCKSSDQTVCYRYFYDAQDRLIEVRDEIYGTVTSREYDAQGNLVREKTGSGHSVSYSFDSLGRPLQVEHEGVEPVLYCYDAANLKHVSWRGFVHSYFAWDTSRFLLEEDNPLGRQKISYDKNGFVTSIASPFWKEEKICYDPGGQVASRILQGKQQWYCYDPLGQLVQEGNETTIDYAYDGHYNRMEKNGVLHTYNALNQLLSDGNFSYSYDRNGNRVQKSRDEYSVNYFYDALDRLISVQKGATRICYRYDDQNRRLSKKIFDGEREVLFHTYLYQGQDEVGAFDSDGKLLQFRVLGVGKGAEIGSAVCICLNDKLFVPQHDHQGHLAALFDLCGSLVEEYDCTAFGEERGGECFQNPWRYSCKRHDEETGLIYFGRRYYDAEIGRWLTCDPMGYQAGPNLYAYVFNSPVNQIDLYGLIAQGMAADGGDVMGTLARVLSLPGKFISLVGDHCIPVPFARDVVSITGRILSGEGVSDYVRSDRQEHSKNFEIDFSLSLPHFTVSLCNGILNPRSDAENSAKNLSNYFGGMRVTTTYNATHGFIADIFECIVNMLGIHTRSVAMKTAEIREKILEAGGVGSGGKVLQIGHSQGGLILWRALQCLTAEERKMIHVITLGSAKIIPKEGLGSCVNYVSKRDIVPFIADPIGIVRAWLKKDDSLKFLDSKGMYFFDHQLDMDTYRNTLIDIGMSFTGKYGGGL